MATLHPMFPKMRLNIISAASVSENPDNYNSNFHTAAESPHRTPPTELPTLFTPWIPLILSSQSLPPSSLQTITLTPAHCQLLLLASTSTLYTQVLNRVYIEELYDEIVPLFRSLVFGQGLWLRLDTCSAKDGVGGEKGGLMNVEDVLLRIMSSQRAIRGIRRALELLGETGEVGVKFYFLPFDGEMDTRFEFRVFCRPGDGVVTAVSQYRWEERSAFAGLEREMLDVVFEGIFSEVMRVHGDILRVVEERKSAMDVLLLEQGFTFDVRMRKRESASEEGKGGWRVVLIELNSFGTRSGCGSCLFHWLRDEMVLYGIEDEVGKGNEEREAEFRISF